MSPNTQHQTQMFKSRSDWSVSSHGLNCLPYFSLLKLGPPLHWLNINDLLFNPGKHKRSRNENNWHLPAGRWVSNTVLKWRFPRQQLIYLLTPAQSHATFVASTDVCETLTFITSTCRSSLSEGVTLTAFSIWLSNCFSSESVSTDTNLSSDSSFCREKLARYRFRQSCLCLILLSATTSKPISVWYYDG